MKGGKRYGEEKREKKTERQVSYICLHGSVSSKLEVTQSYETPSLSFHRPFYHLLGSHQVGELTNGYVKLAKTFTEGGSGNFKEGPGILNGKIKEIAKSQMYSSDQRRCGQKERKWTG